MSDRRKVLHVITALSLGGAETWLIALLRHARKLEMGDEFHILMTGGFTSELDETAKSLGATLHYIRFSRRHFPAFRKQFRTLLERENFTAIHDHQEYSSGWHFVAGAGLLPPIRIVHVHNAVRSLLVRQRTFLQRAIFLASRLAVKRYATHILGTSSQLLEEYGFNQSGFPDQTIRTLHCGFDVTDFADPHATANGSVCAEFGWPAGSKLCLFVGRLDGIDPGDPRWNVKNPEFALDVVHAALERGVDTKLIVVGDGDTMRKILEERVAGWGHSDRIRFAGKRRDVPRLMAASHVCLFPSMEEGLGMVAVEAQAAGMRVLASNTVPREAAAIPSLVKFISLAEPPSSWADELAKLIALPRADSAASAEAIRQTDFSIERSYSSLHRIYENSLHR